MCAAGRPPCGYGKGDTIKILYDPYDGRVQLCHNWWLIIGATFVISLGLAFIVAGVVFWFRACRKR